MMKVWQNLMILIGQFIMNQIRIYQVTRITCISIDLYENKWIGTVGEWLGTAGGLAVFNEGGIVSVDEENTLQETIPN